MTDLDALVADVEGARQRFLALVAGVRADLHRYCARMTGSVSDGEDIVQDTLARAYFALPEVEELPPLRSWLFTIAHRRAIDFLRRYDRRMGQPLDSVEEIADDGAADPEEALAREEAVHTALSAFLELPPAQRSCVILKDVLGHSAEEMAALLELSVPAVKAALYRGRTRLRAQGEAARPGGRTTSEALARYAKLFNAHDWDAVRAMLADEVRLDLVSRSQRSGWREVSGYFTKYGAVDDWYLVPAWLDGREVLAVFRNRRDAKPGYFIELKLAGGRVTRIRDFRYVPYICADAAIEVETLP